MPKTTDQVCQAIKDYWQTLTPQKCSQFIDKLTEIIHQVLEKNGEWIAWEKSHIFVFSLILNEWTM